jgi:dihydroorotase
MTIIHSIPEEMARVALADPTVIVASDGGLENGKGHPRGAATYARVLGHYVREQRVLTLMDALRKMSLMPAQRLGIQSKGRLQPGADADIAVFDPERVSDRATFDDPAQYSEGIPFVIVNGKLVVKDGRLVNDVAPGIGLRR